MPRVAPLVFVSSTYWDLEDYRDAILKSFPRLDVLYRGMEFFGARPEPPRAAMLSDLIQCDLYVGIIAHRYGSIDPKTSLSFTELEYRTAKKHHIPRFIFLIDSNHKVNPATIDKDPPLVTMLDAFKQLVRKELTCEHFTTPEDLVGKVGNSLRAWLDKTEQNWRQMRHMRLKESQTRYINALYSNDPPAISKAIKELVNNPDCRAAAEHFYGLILAATTPSKMVEELFGQLPLFSDDERIAQMLLHLSRERPALRPLVVEAIRRRAQSLTRQVTDQEVERVFELGADGEPDVRREVAHALAHIASKRSNYAVDCRRLVNSLCHDPNSGVVNRARQSRDAMP